MVVITRLFGKASYDMKGPGAFLESRDDRNVVLVIDHGGGAAYDVLTPPVTDWPSLVGGWAFLVFFWIKPQFADEFADRIVAEGREVARLEPRTMAFEAHRLREDPAQFAVFEVFADHAALDHHKRQAHYLDIRRWLDTAQDKPRTHDSGYDVTRVFSGDSRHT